MTAPRDATYGSVENQAMPNVKMSESGAPNARYIFGDEGNSFDSRLSPVIPLRNVQNCAPIPPVRRDWTWSPVVFIALTCSCWIAKFNRRCCKSQQSLHSECASCADSGCRIPLQHQVTLSKCSVQKYILHI